MILAVQFSKRSCLDITCRLCSTFDHLPMCQIPPLDCMRDISSFGILSHALTRNSSRGEVLRLQCGVQLVDMLYLQRELSL